MNSNLIILTLSAAMVIPCAGCATKTEAREASPQSSVALFDSFNYHGNDAYYRENPLPDESSYYNPILPGWYSDPSICTNGEGDYFLVTSTFTYFPGVPIFHSRDLLNWEQVGYVLSRKSQLRNMEKQHVSGGIFAPDITYNPKNKTYYMVTTNVGDGNFFVKTTDPYGEWSDPIMLPEVQGIDPAFFFDEDGKGYIVNNDDAPDSKPEYPGHRTVRVVEFDPATDKCIGERKIVINKGCRPEEKPIWCEGPHIYKHNGDYYLMTAEGGTSTWHSEVIYRGPTPFGPFTPYEGNPILTQRILEPQRTNPVTCAGHADLVKTPEGDWWSVFLAVRPIENDIENLGRETFMLPVKWTSDGWPVIVPNGETVPLMSRKEGVKRGDKVTFGNFDSIEKFDSTELSYDWMTLRGPASDYYSLTENPGYLTLKCAPVTSSEKAEIAYIGRRLHHHDFSADTRLTFCPEHDSQCAGILLMKDETHQYFLGRTKHDKNHCIELRVITEDGKKTLSSAEVDPSVGTIDLKVDGKGSKYMFSYSLDRGETWQPLASDIDAGFTSTAVAGGFTGTTIGMYASDCD